MTSHSAGQVWAGFNPQDAVAGTSVGPKTPFPARVGRSVAFLGVILLAIVLVVFAFVVRSSTDPAAAAIPAPARPELL